jgi:hypothetical protein
MPASSLTDQLVVDLKQDFARLVTQTLPISAAVYLFNNGTKTTWGGLGVHLRQAALETGMNTVSIRLSEFGVLTAWPASRTFRRRLLLRAGSFWTSAVLVSALLRKPFSVNQYVISPLISATVAALQLIWEDETEGDQFVAEYAPGLLTILQETRALVHIGDADAH